ncbi:hypothetical protein PENANT_c079G00962 [Penicillium antarcticum]|uniref:FAD-binding PCMH-type domain-containing protein n=1 Tax=Penicillium antarcticum TaxID=416450 RepID=A0A1V6PPZ9_9EURO|nr:uncharacterized protein N7508_002065 [Penicillium antarcticum]KAJ5317557.1 hypothetical protein N7508_002065 [Penicillium antarcticum]OQD78807.1 hypothetical protein PENANT_c079G00962 [Penicillium antarcticum]
MSDMKPTSSALEDFFQANSIKYVLQSSAEYAQARTVFNASRPDNPLAVVYPQTAGEISTLIKYAQANSIPFTLRTGGHNLEGRTLVEDALVIDLRALNKVSISEDRQSATIQGGTLQGEVGSHLWAEGLGTPLGSVPSVGYVGWATYGGYGAFSSHWGLGVDQILGATVMNPDGEIVTADETILQGIRGAGGLFGVILDLTVQVYPLSNLLAGAIFFDPSDIEKTFVDFNAAYQSLLDTEGLPPQLTLQQMAVNAPPGRMFGVGFVWSGADMAEGQRWKEKIAGLAPLMMNTVAPMAMPDWFAGNGRMIPERVFGFGNFTHSVHSISPAVAGIIGRRLRDMPQNPECMLSVHQLRGPSTKPQDRASVFVAREPHFMLEILGFSSADEQKLDGETWAKGILREIETVEPGNLLATPYISLFNTQGKQAEEVLEKLYGPMSTVVRDLKHGFDRDNVFNLTVPALQ